MKAHDNKEAQYIGQFIEDQLAVAAAFRANPRADVSALYKDWAGRAIFRRPSVKHNIHDLDLLMMEGLLGRPTFYRGFVERVVMRPHRFLELADELFSLAPIRHIGFVNVPRSIDALASSPHLARMRSLALATNGDAESEQLTDDMIERLLDSPYLGNITHLRLGGQLRLTQRSYERIVTAKSLPMLSNFEVYLDGSSTIWQETIRPNYDPTSLTYFEQVMEHYPKTQDLRDTPKPVVLRPEDWIVELERTLGYVPCVHPEEHYGRYLVDIEAVTAHPIAADPAVMARRGQPVPDPGPKPSLMERRSKGQCAICGCADFAFVPDPPSQDPYQGPTGGILTCERCGTRWYSSQWPQRFLG
ncbi:MAG: hypothetical protein R3B48_28720 [Kofleriaceae bacterium]